jgi:hypothetical protein
MPVPTAAMPATVARPTEQGRAFHLQSGSGQVVGDFEVGSLPRVWDFMCSRCQAGRLQEPPYSMPFLLRAPIVDISCTGALLFAVRSVCSSGMMLCTSSVVTVSGRFAACPGSMLGGHAKLGGQLFTYGFGAMQLWYGGMCLAACCAQQCFQVGKRSCCCMSCAVW